MIRSRGPILSLLRMRKAGSASSTPSTIRSASGLSSAIHCAPMRMAMTRNDTNGRRKISRITRHSRASTRSQCLSRIRSTAIRHPLFSQHLRQQTIKPYGRAARRLRTPSRRRGILAVMPSSALARRSSAMPRRTFSPGSMRGRMMSRSRQPVRCSSRRRTPSAIRRASMQETARMSR